MKILACLLILCALQDDKTQQEYEERRISAPQNAKGQYDLGRWCDGRKLKEEALKAYERAVEIDPEFEPARKALGHKKVLGRWVSEKNYADPSWWAHPKVDQKKVDDAILKGCNYLLGLTMKPLPTSGVVGAFELDELVLLTLVQAGWDRKETRFTMLLNRVVSMPLRKTYNVSIKAMALAELDAFKYQQQLAQCAQFLVDNQCENGQWGYGSPIKGGIPQQFPTTRKGPIPDIETGIDAPKPGKKDATPGQIEIKRGPTPPPPPGDNSNSQYAALGLRACLSALVVVPKETIQSAHDYWEKNQQANGGWSYGSPRNEPSDKGDYGSMTAGGLGALAIYKYYLNRVWGEKHDIKAAPSMSKGIAWLGSNLDFSQHVKYHNPRQWHYYWMYAVERAGRLLELEAFGSHEWYPKGADLLLARQCPDGAWQKESWGNAGLQEKLIPGQITETCFAILFLRRATPKLDETIKIKSGDAKEGRIVRPGEAKPEDGK